MGTNLILKEIDSKEEQIKILNDLYEKSTSEKQKKLILSDLNILKSGYEQEKQNAYYLDFYVKDSKNLIIIHDLRIEYNGQSAQCDHILISRFGIEVLESKSSKGKLTINTDGTVSIDYNGKIKNYPSPLEQNDRHIHVLKQFLEDKGMFDKRHDLVGGIDFSSKILLSPETHVINKDLPSGYVRADSFMNERSKEIDKIGIFDTIKLISKAFSIDKALDISNLLINSHKPVDFDYTKKYKLPKTKTEKEETKEVEQKKCPRCNEGILVLRESKKESTKYENNKFLGCNRFPKCRYSQSI